MNISVIFKVNFFCVILDFTKFLLAFLKVHILLQHLLCVKEFGTKILTKRSGSIEQSRITSRFLVSLPAERKPFYLWSPKAECERLFSNLIYWCKEVDILFVKYMAVWVSESEKRGWEDKLSLSLNLPITEPYHLLYLVSWHLRYVRDSGR